MVDATAELSFKFYSVLNNLNLKNYLWLVASSIVVELELEQGFIEDFSIVCLIHISYSVIYCILYLVKVRK